MASSVPPSEPARVAAEFERLANRLWTETEQEVVRRALQGEPVWVEGLRQDGYAHLAVSLAEVARARILFLSPDANQLVERQHRLGTRASTHLLEGRAPTRVAPGHGVFFCSVDALVGDALPRSFAQAPPDFIFVEQAHAASPLSFEFRPALRRVAELCARFPGARVLYSAAFTTEATRQDAWSRLLPTQGATPSLLRESWGPVSLHVVPRIATGSWAEWIAPLPRPALVLCSTPAQADAAYAELAAQGLPCHRYHAGLSPRERATELLQFALPGRRAILIATSSFGPSSGFAGESEGGVSDDFGRGYVRADLRSLVRLGVPSSLEQLSIELGLLRRSSTAEARFTRDPDTEELEAEAPRPARVIPLRGEEEPVFAALVFDPEELAVVHALLDRKRPCADTLHVVVSGLKSRAKGEFVAERALVEAAGGASRPVRLALAFLRDAGAIESAQEAGASVHRARSLEQLETIERLLQKEFATLRQGDMERLRRIEELALGEECRLLGWARLFDEEGASPCGLCDRCKPDAELPQVARRADEAHKRRDPARRFGGAWEEAEDDLFEEEEEVTGDVELEVGT